MLNPIQVFKTLFENHPTNTTVENLQVVSDAKTLLDEIIIPHQDDIKLWVTVIYHPKYAGSKDKIEIYCSPQNYQLLTKHILEEATKQVGEFINKNL